jgi:hypothetical protein
MIPHALERNHDLFKNPYLLKIHYRPFTPWAIFDLFSSYSTRSNYDCQLIRQLQRFWKWNRQLLTSSWTLLLNKYVQALFRMLKLRQWRQLCLKCINYSSCTVNSVYTEIIGISPPPQGSIRYKCTVQKLPQISNWADHTAERSCKISHASIMQ